jgi:MFS family permease
VTLSGFVAAGAALPVLPRFVHGPLHAGDLAVGVVMGVFAVSAVVVRPFAGRWTDRRGRRPVLLIGALLCSIAGTVMLVASSLGVVVAARLVVGAGEGLLFTAASAWVVDLAPEERRGQVIGLFGLSVWGGMTVGPLIGDQLLQAAGFRAVWIMITLVPLAGTLVALGLPERWRPPAGSEARSLLPRPILAPGAALALASVGYATLAGFVVLLLEHRGIGHGALVFTAYAAAVVASRVLLGRVPDALGPRGSAALAGLAEAAGLALIAQAHSWQMAALGAVVMGGGFSLLYPALALGVVQSVGKAARGSALGGFTAFFDIGMGLGAPTIGAIASVAGYSAAFWAGAGAALAAGMIAWLCSANGQAHQDAGTQAARAA